MTNKELYIILISNIILTLRMLGIFMILPILSSYGLQLKGSNELLIGVTIGIYGIMQIIFQIPFGLLSDTIGRKPVIIAGLIISAIGTSISGITNNIWGVILGRSLQGASAITSVIITLLLDFIKEKNTTKALMSIGLNFSITFAISIIISPVITAIIGLHGLFFSITLLTFLAIILSLYFLPSSKQKIKQNNFLTIKKYKILLDIFINQQCIKLNFSIFCLHTILIFNFISIPKIMNYSKLLPMQQSMTYLISIIIALSISGTLILYCEKKQYIKQLLIVSIHTLLSSEIIILCNTNNFQIILTSMILFFLSFNIIEGILPSILIKTTPKTYKGTITSTYSTSQFLGITCGGIFGGYLLEKYNLKMLFCSEIILTILWLIITITLYEPKYITHLYVPLTSFNSKKQILKILYSKPGVLWVQIIPQNGTIYIIINIKKIKNCTIINNIIQNNKELK